jgi:protein O-GlcNAc transferase
VSMTALDWLIAGNARCAAGDLPGTIYAIRRALALDPSVPATHMALITNLDMLPWTSDAVKRAARAEFDRRFIRPIMARHAVPSLNDPDPERRLRIGYVSSDLFASSAAFCHGALILASDHRQADIYVYHSQSPRAQPDDMVTPLFREAADVWRDVTSLGDERVADLIRHDRIDVLVDLGGYSSGARMLVFGYRAAPIQITGWGHATGTDLSCFDYTVADAVCVPPEDEHRHREAILRVPSIITYVPTYPSAEQRYHPITYVPGSMVTFGNLGRPEKLSQPCLAVWADILHAVPGSRLLLKSEAWAHEQRRAQVLLPLGAYGIGSDRVIFRGETANAAHLAAYNEIDVHLDAFPHTGGVTTLDACWMGCPTVTLKGSAISHRISASILTTLGQHGRIADTAAEYVDRAVWLADLVSRGAFKRAARERMRREMEQSVLVDGARYARSVEAGYREIWRRWCSTQAPARVLTAVS